LTSSLTLSEQFYYTQPDHHRNGTEIADVFVRPSETQYRLH
jgi:hypothetical protein